MANGATAWPSAWGSGHSRKLRPYSSSIGHTLAGCTTLGHWAWDSAIRRATRPCHLRLAMPSRPRPWVWPGHPSASPAMALKNIFFGGAERAQLAQHLGLDERHVWEDAGTALAHSTPPSSFRHTDLCSSPGCSFLPPPPWRFQRPPWSSSASARCCRRSRPSSAARALRRGMRSWRPSPTSRRDPSREQLTHQTPLLPLSTAPCA